MSSNEPTAAEVANRLQIAIDTHSNLNIMTIRESVRVLLEERKELLAVVRDAKERPWNLFNRREWLKRVLKVEALQ